MKEDVAITVLRQVKEVLDKQGVEYWIDMGTLLGAVRDGKIIPWDTDIDLGIWDNDFDEVAKACMVLRGKGFKIYFGINHVGIFKYKNGAEYLVGISAYTLNNNQALLTWFVHSKERYYDDTKIVKRKTQQRIRLLLEYFVWLLSAPICSGDNPKFIPYNAQIALVKFCHIIPTGLRELLTKTLLLFFKIFGCKYLFLEIPSNYFKDLSRMKFYGMEFNTPSKAEEYLEYKYGKEWRTPQKKWIYYTDDGAIAKKIK